MEKKTTMTRIMELVSVIKTKETDPEEIEYMIDSVQRYLKNLPGYFNAVISYVINGNFISVRYEGEEYRNRMQELDKTRRDKHILATDSVNIINRIAKKYGMDEIFKIGRDLDSSSIDDREIAVALVYSFCTEAYLDETIRKKYDINGEDMDAEIQKLIKERLQFSEKFDLEERSVS